MAPYQAVRNLKITVEYDGTRYFGFQKQPGRPTVQGELERAVLKITKAPARVIGAGRTDAGVHALGQVVNFKTESGIPLERLCVALNSVLPPDIVAKAAEEVPEDFHARFSARSKIYRYTILVGQRSALLSRYAFPVELPLNLTAMQEAAGNILGAHDFFAFSSGAQESENTMRDLMGARISRKGRAVRITLEANAFLHHMVRILVALLVEVGTGKRPPESPRTILEARCRPAVTWIAPACGLCLVKVKYF